MSTRVRWIILGVIVLIVLGVSALYWFNTNLTDVTVTDMGGRRTWIVQSGQTAKLSADEVEAEDRYACEFDGRVVYTVDGTPSVGKVSWSGDFTVSTTGGGTVILTCLPDPPGNV
jgi:hypothetical protein